MGLSSVALGACSPGKRFGEFVFDETPPPEATTDEQDGATDSASETSTIGAAAADPERLYILLSENVTTLDPTACTARSEASVARCIVEGLVRETDDGSTVEPCLAENWDVDDTGAVYTFYLAPGLTFSDGTPVTAQDWEWSFERARAAVDAPWHASLDKIASLQCPDDQTVVVTFNQADEADAAHLCTYALGVQSKARFDEVGKSAYGTMKGGASCAPLGTGAWRLGAWNPDGTVELAVNEQYRGEALPVLQGVVFASQTDDEERVRELQRGSFDVAEAISADLQLELESDPNCVSVVDRSITDAWTVPVSAIPTGTDGANADAEQAEGAAVNESETSLGEAEPSQDAWSLAYRKSISGLVRTPMGGWRLDSTAKAAE